MSLLVHPVHRQRAVQEYEQSDATHVVMYAAVLRHCHATRRDRCRLASMHGPIKHRSAGIVVVRRQNGEWRLLLLRAYRNWDFPKGLLEPGEQPFAAAVRETEEETGLTDLDFRWGAESIDTEMYGDHKVVSFYLAETRQERIVLPVNPELGHPEHDEFRWVGMDEAQQLLPARLQSILHWAHKTLSAGA
jgi:8-oxo-dGTP pyrophosphatase MutT (NUDIX family)